VYVERWVSVSAMKVILVVGGSTVGPYCGAHRVVMSILRGQLMMQCMKASGRSVGVIVAYWVTQKNHRAVMSEKDVDGV